MFLLLHKNDLAALFAKLFLKEAGELFGLWRVIMARLQRPWDNQSGSLPIGFREHTIFN